MGHEELIPKPEVVVRKEGEDAFLFDPGSGNLLCVNRLGFFIWDCLNKKYKKDDIVKLIFEEHQAVSPDKVKDDYDKFVNILKDNAFLGVKCSI